MRYKKRKKTADIAQNTKIEANLDQKPQPELFADEKFTKSATPNNNAEPEYYPGMPTQPYTPETAMGVPVKTSIGLNQNIALKTEEDFNVKSQSRPQKIISQINSKDQMIEEGDQIFKSPTKQKMLSEFPGRGDYDLEQDPSFI